MEPLATSFFLVRNTIIKFDWVYTLNHGSTYSPSVCRIASIHFIM